MPLRFLIWEPGWMVMALTEMRKWQEQAGCWWCLLGWGPREDDKEIEEV